eukprot:762026-Hanusia_phi.AAC.2
MALLSSSGRRILYVEHIELSWIAAHDPMSYRRSQIGKLLHLDVGDCDSTSPVKVSASQYLAKLARPKTVFFIRHAEAEHNSVADWGIRDPVLTENGWNQARSLRHQAILRDALGFSGKDKVDLPASPPFADLFAAQRAQLIVVSPLRRTLQTAQAVAALGAVAALVTFVLAGGRDHQEHP